MKTTKMIKKTMRTQNILIINHLLDVTDWKYFNSSPCAASTFSSVASTLASILNTERHNNNGALEVSIFQVVFKAEIVVSYNGICFALRLLGAEIGSFPRWYWLLVFSRN